VADNPFANLVRGECQVCHTKVDGRSYYCADHKPAKSNKKRNTEAEPINISVSSQKRNNRKGPTAETYWATFGDAIVVLLNYVLLRPLDSVPNSDAIQEKLMITKDEAQTLTRPLLRLFSETPISRSNGGAIIENADVIPALLVAMSIIERMKTIRAIVEANQTGSTNETIQANVNVGADLRGFGPVLIEDLERAQGKAGASD
jgi:hypothetical protein